MAAAAGAGVELLGVVPLAAYQGPYCKSNMLSKRVLLDSNYNQGKEGHLNLAGNTSCTGKFVLQKCSMHHRSHGKTLLSRTGVVLGVIYYIYISNLSLI